MGFIDTALAKNNFKHKNSADEMLSKIGRKLPKKVRKKLRWKKIAPILSVLITVLTHLTGAGSHQRKTNPKPSAEKPPYSVPSHQQSLTPSRKFKDDTLGAYVVQADAYQLEIDRLAQNSMGEDNKSRVRELAIHVQAWTTSIANLAQRIEDFRRNKLITQDLKNVPKSITSLEARLSHESDSLMVVELERTLANRRQQLSALKKLQRSIQLAEIKMESTLSMLGTIYSQILAGQSTRQIADYRRLLGEIDEEVHTLQDHLEALEEVKLART